MQRPLKFGKYLLLERIAVGGMAEVYAAKAFGVEGFERILAIKKILPTMGEDPEFVSMFVDEARIAVQLSHANIVQVLELGKHDDSLYIAMEYVAGRNVRQLSERYRRQGLPMPTPQTCAIVARACEALDHAHRKCDASGRPLGIVHRDVSPQNVLVSFNGDVKLIDFGIAKAETRLQRTQSGILKGKFSYMSPEQVQGQSIDRRSDVFSAGVLLWELLCGRKLFTGENDLALLEKVRRTEVPPPRSLNPEIPGALEAVVLKALAPDREQRYQWCSELHDDLVRFAAAGETVFSSRRLGEWIREEFRDDYESEQSRMRQWLEIRVPLSAPGSGAASDPATTIPVLAEAGAARAMVQDTPEWRVVPERDTADLRAAGEGDAPELSAAPERDTLVEAATGTGANPTILLRPGEAHIPLFDMSQERTAALRSARFGALSRPPPRRSGARGIVLAGAALAVALVAGTAYVLLSMRDPGTLRPSTEKKLPPTPVLEASVAPPVTSADPAPAAAVEPRLHIVSDPAGAQITLSGRTLGRAPLTTDPLSADIEYEVSATLQGYQTVRRLVRASAGVKEVTLFLLSRRVAGADPAQSKSR